MVSHGNGADAVFGRVGVAGFRRHGAWRRWWRIGTGRTSGLDLDGHRTVPADQLGESGGEGIEPGGEITFSCNQYARIVLSRRENALGSDCLEK